MENYMLKFLVFCLISFQLMAVEYYPIVTVEEKLRLEQLCYEAGATEEEFMQNASRGACREAEKLTQGNSSYHISLLVGRGYKGGSALKIGETLLKKGYEVDAFLSSPIEDLPSLCQLRAREFQQAGGRLHHLQDFPLLTIMIYPSPPELIIDGLLGTGFKGTIQSPLLEVIERANQSQRPILAIDIPSGLNGDTGEVGTVAIKATHTATMGLPKIGLFLGEGKNYVGTLSIIDIGMSQSVLNQAKPVAFLRYEDPANFSMVQNPL